MKDNIQRFGKFLSGMVMPNIGAFIAWGFLTAFFIPTGWFPNESFGALVDPIIKYLLPLLVGITGGNIVAGTRGGVMAGVATMGVIVGADIPMFIGAMIMGPLSGYAIKKFDKFVENKTPAGFEMLVNNFSIGILGMLFALLGLVAIGPLVVITTTFLKTGVEIIITKGLLPLVAIFIEPAKVLFLNNAINHGVLGPIGIEQAQSAGKSIMFLLESNPGPGLGVILAYWIYSKGAIKQSAPGAAIIHFFGGIHEIYFPYVLMNPLLIIAVIAGGAIGILIFSILGAGLVATPSPGSILALMALAPKGGILPILAGVLGSTAVSFIVAAPFIKRNNKNSGDSEKLDIAKQKLANMKQNKKEKISKIIFACDAGMGSSAMGATKFRNKIKTLGLNIEVKHSSVDNIPLDTDVVVSHIRLVDRAKNRCPKAEHIFIDNFLQDDKIDELFLRLQKSSDNKSNNIVDNKISNKKLHNNSEDQTSNILTKDNILLNLVSESKENAIERAGKLLLDLGYVNDSYIEAMQDREKLITTYIGMGVAIPHGTARDDVKKSGIVVLQYPKGVKFGDELAYLVIGIAGIGDEHLDILSNIATSLDVDGIVDTLSHTGDKSEILKVFQNKE